MEAGAMAGEFGIASKKGSEGKNHRLTFRTYYAYIPFLLFDR